MKKSKKETSKVNMNSNISYKGEVTIKLMHGNHVYKTIKNHNEGKNSLFEFLGLCLAGTYIEEKTPKYIRAFNCNDNVFTYDNPSMNSGVAYSSLDFKNESNITSYTFLIPGTTFIPEKKTNTFAIYSSENYSNLGSPSAVYYLKKEEELIIDRSTNIVLVWEMKVDNK